MSSIVVSELEYAPPGSDSLFFDVGFGVGPGEHAALVGANGVGKSTILRILSGVIEADSGEFALDGNVLTMTQDVGMARPDDTLREMLIEVARRLSLSVRKGDIAARFGGDEFVIAFDFAGDDTAISRVCQRVIQAITAPVEIDGAALSVGCSIGSAVFPKDGATVADLLGAADNALYRSKNQGRGIHVAYGVQGP